MTMEVIFFSLLLFFAQIVFVERISDVRKKQKEKQQVTLNQYAVYNTTFHNLTRILRGVLLTPPQFLLEHLLAMYRHFQTLVQMESPV